MMPLENNNIQKKENWRLGFIKFLYIQLQFYAPNPPYGPGGVLQPRKLRHCI